MERGAWQAIVHGVTRVRHDLATKPPPPKLSCKSLSMVIEKDKVTTQVKKWSP